MSKAPKFDNSPADQREDRANAAKFGMSVSEWKGSPGDIAADRMGQRALEIKAGPERAKRNG